MFYSIFLLNVNLLLLTGIKLCTGAAFFPTNSAYGIFAAIAVPLDLPHRNVFLSYNFEANYNLPYTWDIPPVAYGIEEEDILEQARKCANCTKIDETARSSNAKTLENNDKIEENADESAETQTTEEATTTESSTESSTTTRKPKTKRKRIRRSLLSRRHFYHILMDKFQRSGYKGEPCLLRLICETNASELGDINGILGNLIHIIFSPSTSMNEELPLAYYQAEVDGIHEQCEHYTKDCKENLLDLISTPLVDIIKTMMINKSS